MKNKILFILTLVLLVTGFRISVNAHYDTAYWNEGKRAQTRSGWMHWLDDNKRVNQLSLPGTHDTMAFRKDLIGNDITRCQTADLYEQLVSGIRVIDIRVNYENERYLTCYHGIVYLGYDFNYVLDTVSRFLNENPTEAVFMRFKQENSSASDSQMQAVFLYYYNLYSDLFYKDKDSNPTVKQVRGKLVLVSDVWSLNQYGISYRSLDIQDEYYVATNWDLYGKWEKVKNQLERSNTRKDNDIYMNYLSASGGAFPYFIASGHSSASTRDDRLSTGLTEPGFWYCYPDFPRGAWFLCFATIYFEGVNTLTANYLVNNNIKYCGMVMADFPGERLINSIIECNRK